LEPTPRKANQHFGLANPDAASAGVARAGKAKGDGITIFTIGLGRDADLDVAALEQMASRRGFCYRAPDGEDLLAIYGADRCGDPLPGEAVLGTGVNAYRRRQGTGPDAHGIPLDEAVVSKYTVKARVGNALRAGWRGAPMTERHAEDG
jgi:hypothetical protein